MSARDKAERCFALARSTTFEGERSNAIAQGTRIAEAAGLSLDLFDIPGRQRAKPAGPSWKPERPSMRMDADLSEHIKRARDRMFEDAFYGRNTTAQMAREREQVQASLKRAREAAEDQRVGVYILAIQRIGGKVRRVPSLGESLWTITSPKGGEAIVNLAELIEVAGLAMGRRA